MLKHKLTDRRYAVLEENIPKNIYSYSKKNRFLIWYLTTLIIFTVITVLGLIPISILWKLANPNESIEILSALNKELMFPWLASMLIPAIKWHLDSERRETN